MNPNISRLNLIAGKPSRLIIGLMSGTSLDGLDIALCQFKGSGVSTSIQLKKFVTKEYPPEFKEELKSIFAKTLASLEKVTLLNEFIGSCYAELINECLVDWGIEASEVDLIASHGQTIYHAPKHQRPPDYYGNATLQIGDRDHLAVKSKIITISDFRQKHIAAGGEGAPLAVYGDYIIFSDPAENRIMLNIGGIANFTYLPARWPEGFFSTDIGPGNTIMDQFIQLKFPGRYYDKNSEIGLQGVINEALLRTLFEHPFFLASFPKTTGPELFNLEYLNNAIALSSDGDLSAYDIMATLAAFSAQAIIRAVSATISATEDFKIYMSGGGMYNPLLVRHLEIHFLKKIKSTSDLNINPDAKEAVLFALLANEAVAGGSAYHNLPPGLPRVAMGKISFPD